MTLTQYLTLIVSCAYQSLIELQKGNVEMYGALMKGLISLVGEEATTLAGGKCLRTRPDLYVSSFSSYSSSKIFRTLLPHTALAQSVDHFRSSGCPGCLHF